MELVEAESKPPSYTYDKGFCTHAFLLRGKTLPQLEQLLGFRRGRLDAGATVLFLEDLPGPDDFQLAGYTYFSDGAVQGHKLGPKEREPYKMEVQLKAEFGWTDAILREQKRKMIGSKIVIVGHERLAKLVPSTPHTEQEMYPPGDGVFQVNIVRPIRFKVKDRIPSGGVWLGSYT